MEVGKGNLHLHCTNLTTVCNSVEKIMVLKHLSASGLDNFALEIIEWKKYNGK